MPLSSQPYVAHAEDPNDDHESVRKKTDPSRKRRRKDALSHRVRHYRKQCEKRSNTLEKVEGYVLMMVTIIGLSMVVFLAVSLLADIECALCMDILISAAVLVLTTWSFFKTRVLIAEAIYKKHRKKQKSRFYSRKARRYSSS